MEINTAIEIKAFGDFDIKYTECIMVSSNKIDVYEIMKEFYNIKGITSSCDLDYSILREVTQDFIVFLKSKGFNKLETCDVLFSD
jgi:hypothetical protein